LLAEKFHDVTAFFYWLILNLVKNFEFITCKL
jgi:hypothetical protein